MDLVVLSRIRLLKTADKRPSKDVERFIDHRHENIDGWVFGERQELSLQWIPYVTNRRT